MPGPEKHRPRATIDNAVAAARAGGQLQDIVTMTAFIIDAGYSGRFIDIRKSYFPSGNFPCSALIVAAGFAKPGLMVEIQAVAVVEPE